MSLHLGIESKLAKSFKFLPIKLLIKPTTVYSSKSLVIKFKTYRRTAVPHRGPLIKLRSLFLTESRKNKRLWGLKAVFIKR